MAIISFALFPVKSVSINGVVGVTDTSLVVVILSVPDMIECTT